jgi:glycosyltransferase involved in cell wall biosynthesis
MRILYAHHGWFTLTHGGFQTHVEGNRKAVEAHGISVDWARWWDDSQQADLIHAFAPIPPAFIRQAHAKNIPVVLTSLQDRLANMPARQLLFKRATYRFFDRLPGFQAFWREQDWQATRLAVHNIVNIPSHAAVLRDLFSVPSDRVTPVPLAVEDIFHQASPSDRTGDHLVCVATISPRKGILELARMARIAQVPVLFIGKPYGTQDPYWLQFKEMVDGHLIRYDGDCRTNADLVARLQKARGFVINSRCEAWCLAVDEAIACGLPVLVPEAPWSADRLPPACRQLTGSPADIETLRAFYESCPTVNQPQPKLWTWPEVGVQLKDIYRTAIQRFHRG